jgi:protein involved in polysaccharide export with SLBB domain
MWSGMTDLSIHTPRAPRWPSLRTAAVLSILTVGIASAAPAQSTDLKRNEGAMQPVATRAELTTLAARLESGDENARRQGTALRARLREGDFRPGDRIFLAVEGAAPLLDTLAVSAGPKVTIPDIGDISLAGVLRSELPEHMRTQLSKYVRDARVRSTALVRVSLTGPIARPGVYYMPPDTPIGDAIMRAGGPGSTADMSRSIIRRNTTVLYDKRRTHSAFTDGVTLDQLSLRSGDEIVVGEKSARNWTTVASVVGTVTSLALALSYAFSR